MQVLRARAVIITLGGLGVLLPTAARAAPALAPVPAPWATVNVCDTAAAPNTIGVRALMPRSSNGRQERSMRFVIQFFSESDRRWLPVAEGGDSGYLSVGRGTEPREFGRSFRIDPMPGESVLLRGKVTFRWRGRGGVARYARVLTHAGHRSTEFADPPGFSAATCRITSA